MKSEYPELPINFDELSARLRIFLDERINRGEFTERSLARVLRISQPHLHNMLKGIRRVHTDFADRVLMKFNISVLDLLADEELWNHLDKKNPNWMMFAATRKPPGKTSRIEGDLPRKRRVQS